MCVLCVCHACVMRVSSVCQECVMCVSCVCHVYVMCVLCVCRMCVMCDGGRSWHSGRCHSHHMCVMSSTGWFWHVCVMCVSCVCNVWRRTILTFRTMPFAPLLCFFFLMTLYYIGIYFYFFNKNKDGTHLSIKVFLTSTSKVIYVTIQVFLTCTSKVMCQSKSVSLVL